MEVPWNVLEGKVVLVTGASSGIGRELCIDLARAGCRVVAAARRTERLKLLCDEINGNSPSVHENDTISTVRCAAVELDVSAGGAEIEESVKKAWNQFGRIDVLINNAGIRGGVHSATDWPEEEWHNVTTTNLTGLWLVTKHVCKLMKDAKLRGSVINISSISGLDRSISQGSGAYTASKTGVHAITKVMALELGLYDIRVNAIAPGLFMSEITEGLLKKKGLDGVLKKLSPLKTNGTTDPALTSLIRLLIHDCSHYLTGNVFIVDAGLSLPGLPIFSSL